MRLKNLRAKYYKNIFIGYININSIRNKLSGLSAVIGSTFDVLSIAETKLDSSFPSKQFELDGYKQPYRLDISSKSGGLLVFVKSDIPSKLLSGFVAPKGYQFVSIELNLRKQKWLIVSIYRPPSLNIDTFLNCLSNVLDFYASYDRVIVMGDFNSDPKTPALSNFLYDHNLFNHVHQNTCWKSSKGTCIDLILSNHKFSLQNTSTFETGLSDHHSLIYTILKTTFEKIPPKKIYYRSYKNFNHRQFNTILCSKLSENDIYEYNEFETTFVSVLDRLAPTKSKIVRGNQKPHINKTLRKAIMTRSRLKSIANKTGNPEDLQAYKRQRNYIVSLNKKAKRMLFNNLDINPSPGHKQFWKVCNPLFGNKSTGEGNKILLVENQNITSDEESVASIFNSYFNNITQELNLQSWKVMPLISNLDPIQTAMEKYKSHPSILKIKSKTFESNHFSFQAVTEDEVQKLIINLDSRKKTSGIIPVKLLQANSSVCSTIITRCINQAIRNCQFPSKLKLADIIPIHKKGETTIKSNYRPISLLPAVSKLFEKIMFSQINTFFQSRFATILCGFRKGHSTQHALFNLIQNWQVSLDNGEIVGTLLMDLSKAYDCIPYELLLAKLEAYGFSENSLNFLYSYLVRREHRVKIGATFSSWLESISGVPQGSILGPLLFNIFINDLFEFLSKTSICNFADDNSLYTSGTSLDIVANKLKHDTSIVLRWFTQNSLAANPEKFQVMFLGIKNNLGIELDINGTKIFATNSVKLLGVLIDHKLTFSSHIETMCKQASMKTKALLRVRKYLTLSKASLLFKAYVLGNFFYCPIIWMFCSKTSHNLINKTHCRALCAVFFRFDLNLDQLLQLDRSFPIHTRHLQILMTEVFKSVNKLNPEFMWGCFKMKETPYNLRSKRNTALPPYNTRYFGLNSIIFRASFLWNYLPNYLKCCSNLNQFKRKIKSWDGSVCTCLICRRL